MKKCKGCTERFVGCHSQCQHYIVSKVIGMYKHEKRYQERENNRRFVQDDIYNYKLRKKLMGINV